MCNTKMSSLTDASPVTASEQEALVSSSAGRASFPWGVFFFAEFLFANSEGPLCTASGDGWRKARKSGEDGLALILSL